LRNTYLSPILPSNAMILMVTTSDPAIDLWTRAAAALTDRPSRL
jgi:hypothetical protein